MLDRATQVYIVETDEEGQTVITPLAPLDSCRLAGEVVVINSE